MPNITVTYAELETVAAQLGAGREDITLRLQQLHGCIQHLVTTGFVTEHASGRFTEAYASYSASAEAVITQLSEIQSFLTHTAHTMREIDTHIAARIG